MGERKDDELDADANGSDAAGTVDDVPKSEEYPIDGDDAERRWRPDLSCCCDCDCHEVSEGDTYIDDDLAVPALGDDGSRADEERDVDKPAEGEPSAPLLPPR